MKRTLLIAAIYVFSTLSFVAPAKTQSPFFRQRDRAAHDVFRKNRFLLPRAKDEKHRWDRPPAFFPSGPFRIWHEFPHGINIPFHTLGHKPSSHFSLNTTAADNPPIAWEANYASQLAPSRDWGEAVAVDGAGNIYVTGVNNKLPYGVDCLTIKYNPTGVKVWIQHYNSLFDHNDWGTAIAVDTAGNVYVAGSSVGAGTAYDYLTIKYDANGGVEWTARYNGPANSNDYLRSLAIDDSGNVYLTGESAGSEYATVKYNTNGVQQWVARYQDPQNLGSSARALALDTAGNVYVAGVSGGDYATIKYNAAGIAQWVARYNAGPDSRSEAVAVKADRAGNVYVAGNSQSSISAAVDYLTVKYNAAGVEQWAVRYDGPANDHDFASVIAVDNAGEIYVTGSSWGHGSFGDYATIKYDAAGNQQWIDRYNGPANDFDTPNAMMLDAVGNLYVTGGSRAIGERYYSDDYATIKYTPSGARLWTARYNGPGNEYDEARSVVVDLAGNVYVTGGSEAEGGDDDCATIKYDANGVQQWVDRYTGPGNSRDYARAFAIDEAGNVYVTGFSEGLQSATDFATVRFNGLGVQQWAARYNGPGNFLDYIAAVKVDHAGNVYVTGTSEGVDTRGDYATIKYDSNGRQQWVARYNAPGNLPDSPAALEVDRLGNVYVAGSAYHTTDGTNADYTTIKYDANGREQWLARYNGPSNSHEVLAGLAVDAIGNVFVTGTSSGQGSDCMTIKYNSAGVEQWAARYHHADRAATSAQAIVVDKSGNIFVTGTIRSGPQYDFVTIKYQLDGAQQWAAIYSGPGNAYDRVAALAVDKTGNVYVTGSSFETGKNVQYVTIKYNSQGVKQWLAYYSGNGTADFEAAGICVDDAGNVYVTGTAAFSIPAQTTIKYNAAGEEQWVARRDGTTAGGIALDRLGNPYAVGSTSGYGWSIFSVVKYLQNEGSLALPTAYALAQNHPNPFSHATSIRYGLAAAGRVTIKVFNLAGQEVATILEAEQTAGGYEVDWGMENLPNGVYVYRLQVNGITQTKKFVLLR